MNLKVYEHIKSLDRAYFFFIVLLVLGLILRVFLSPYLIYRGDFGSWLGWANQVYSVGFSEFYEKYWCDYMPGYINVLWLLRKIQLFFPGFPVEILYKLPANLSDLGISVLIFYALRKITNKKAAIVSSLVYFFNPASLSNSALWGQVDSVNVLAILLSILFVVRGNYMTSGAFASIAFMIKPQSVVIFPIVGVLSLRNILRRERKFSLEAFMPCIKFVAISIITTYIIIITPYIYGDLKNLSSIFIEPVSFAQDRFFTSYNQYKYASLNAFNFWGTVAMWKSDEIEFFNITYQRWGMAIFSLIYFVIIGLLLRFEMIRKADESGEFLYRVFQAATLILLALFLFVTRAHERHLLPTIVFFSLIAYRFWIYRIFYFLISIVYVINMTYAYVKLQSKWFSVSAINSFIPDLFFILLFIFLIVFLDFIGRTAGIKRISRFYY